MKKILLLFAIILITILSVYSQTQTISGNIVRGDTLKKYKGNKIIVRDSTLFQSNLRSNGWFRNDYNKFTLVNDGTRAGSIFSAGGHVYSNGITITAADTTSILSHVKSGRTHSVYVKFNEMAMRYVRRTLPYSESRFVIKHDSIYVKSNNTIPTFWDTTATLFQFTPSFFSEYVTFSDTAEVVVLKFNDGTTQITAAIPPDTLTWLDPVVSFKSFSACNSADSANRYIAATTGGGWTINRIYECDGSSWTETIPVSGDAVTVIDSAEVYVFDGSSWISTTISAYWAANGNNIFNVNSSNVGIGTVTPTSKLHVFGSIRASAYLLSNSITMGGSQGIRATLSSFPIVSGVQAGAVSDLKFKTNNGDPTATTRLTIAANGNSTFEKKLSARDSITVGADSDSLSMEMIGSSFFINKNNSGFNSSYIEMGEVSGGAINLWTTNYGVSIFEDPSGSGFPDAYPLRLYGAAILSDSTRLEHKLILPEGVIADAYDTIVDITTNSSTRIGKSAGRSNMGLYNSFLGYQSGFSNTIGTYNVFAGYNAGYNTLNGTGIVAIGKDAGYNTTGDQNVMVGYEAGYTNTSGIQNTFLGHLAGHQNLSGHFNVAIGRWAGYWNSTGQYNINIGGGAGENNLASENVFLGYQSGYSNTTGTPNINIGYRAGYNNLAGVYNTILGYEANYFTEGSANTLIGFHAGYGNLAHSKSNSTAVGFQALIQDTSDGNIGFGYRAGYNNTSGTFNTFVGYDCGFNNITGGNNTFLGYQAGFGNGSVLGAKTGSIAIGYQAGYNDTLDNRLYIENSNADSTGALLFGNFATNQLTINGSLIITQGLTHNVTSISATYSLLLSDYYIIATTGIVNDTINLHTAVGYEGKTYVIKKIDAGVGVLVLDGNGAETIDGSSTILMPSLNDAVIIFSDGSNWFIY